MPGNQIDGSHDFGAQSAPFLVLLLDQRVFVIHSEGTTPSVLTGLRNSPGGGSADAANKDQLQLAWPADVEVLANHFSKEHPSGNRSVEHPRQEPKPLSPPVMFRQRSYETRANRVQKTRC
jgi:hypothetical protein